MNLKSFFELENVIFSKEELEAPYENKSKAPSKIRVKRYLVYYLYNDFKNYDFLIYFINFTVNNTKNDSKTETFRTKTETFLIKTETF